MRDPRRSIPTRVGTVGAAVLLAFGGLTVGPLTHPTPTSAVSCDQYPDLCTTDNVMTGGNGSRDVPPASESSAGTGATTGAAGDGASQDPGAVSTSPPSVGEPGTTNAGTTIRGVIGILIGLVIVVFGWRRRRRPSAPPKGLQRP